MGQQNKAQEAKKDSKRRARVNQQLAEGADWTAVDAELLKDAIAKVAKQGGALRLGYTRDGGAICIGIYGDGEPYNEYLKPSDDTDDFLRRLSAAWEG